MGKDEIRASIRARRRARYRGEDGQDERARTGRLLARAGAELMRSLGESAPPGATVASFESLPAEPLISGLNEALTRAGYEVIVPATQPDLDLDWRHPAPEGTPGTGGPLLGREAISRARVLFVPALAVDQAGTRLGQGGGSYDRALARRGADALVVAVVHDDELLPGPLPREAHDEGVDAVLLPGGYRRLAAQPR